MSSKLVAARGKSTRSVVIAAEIHAVDLAAALRRELTPHLAKGEVLPDIALVSRLLSRRLQAGLARLYAADRAHELELGDDPGPREARDEAADRVRSSLVNLRDAVSTAYGRSGLKKLALTEAIPIDPAAIAARAETTTALLRDESIKLPKSRLTIDRKGFSDEISAGAKALVRALAGVASEERRAAATQSEKSEAMAAHDRRFSLSATLLAALASFGGLDDLAAGLRPSARRPGRLAAEEAALEADAAAVDDDRSAPSARSLV